MKYPTKTLRSPRYMKMKYRSAFLFLFRSYPSPPYPNNCFLKWTPGTATLGKFELGACVGVYVFVLVLFIYAHLQQRYKRSLWHLEYVCYSTDLSRSLVSWRASPQRSSQPSFCHLSRFVRRYRGALNCQKTHAKAQVIYMIFPTADSCQAADIMLSFGFLLQQIV